MPLGCNDCMRLCWFPFTRERSEDLGGMGLVVYELAGRLSRAFSSSALAARMMAADVFGRVVSVGEPGFKGRGGGARSGSALSHLRRCVSRMLVGGDMDMEQETAQDERRTLGWRAPRRRNGGA